MQRLTHFLYYIIFLFTALPGLFSQEGVQIVNEGDTLVVCAGESVALTATGVDTYLWSPAEIFDRVDSSEVIVTPTESGFVFVAGTLNEEETTDSIFIQVVNSNISISWMGGNEPICEGEPIQLSAVIESDMEGEISWEAFGNTDIPTEADVDLSAPRGGQVVGIFTAMGCTVTDTLQIDVIDFGVPTLTTLDTLVCQGQQFPLASDPGESSTIYTWTPETFLSDPSIANPIFTAGESDVTYIFEIESEDGACQESFEINIEVTPISLELNVMDTVLMCIGDTIDITAVVNGDPSGFSWSPDDEALSSLTDLDIQAFPEFSNFYYATYELNGCTLIDTIFLKVDSLPVDTRINVVPFEEDYCPGEELSLFSGMYNGLLFPDITHSWEPRDGSLRSAPDGYNLFIETTVTNTYIRTLVNGGCIREDSIEIIVKQPSIELNINEATVCPGDPVQLMVLNDVSDISWQPEQWLSCTDCPDPIATPLQTITYTVSGEVEECPTSAQVQINVFPTPSLSITVAPEGNIFIGDSTFLKINSFPPLGEGAMFEWVYNGNNIGTMGDSILVFADLPMNSAQATYTTPDGCEITVSINFTAMEPEYEIPNAFTPDNDTFNDVFQAVLRGDVDVVEMRIYSRWGQLIYEGSDNEGWDGTFNGNPSPPDVYAYTFIFQLPNGRTFQERGDVTLVR